MAWRGFEILGAHAHFFPHFLSLREGYRRRGASLNRIGIGLRHDTLTDAIAVVIAVKSAARAYIPAQLDFSAQTGMMVTPVMLRGPVVEKAALLKINHIIHGLSVNQMRIRLGIIHKSE